MATNKENFEKLFKRIEFGKVALKKRFADKFPELGVFELDYSDYPKLYEVLKLIDLYFKKHGIPNWNIHDDFDKLPYKLQDLFLKIYYKSLNRRINGLSEQSKIFFMIDMTAKKIKVDDRDIEIEYSDDIIKRWTKHTMIMVITGYLGKGKTDFSLRISEWGIKNKFMYVFHNIDMDVGTDYDGIYHEVSRLSELLINIYKYKGKQKLFIMDEAGIHISHRTSMSSSNIIFMHLSKLLRKLKTHWILISQRESIDKEIREFATIWIKKEDKDKAKVTELFNEEPKTYYITNIPRTSIKYDTNDVADFKIDIHVKYFDKILEAIAKKVSFKEFEFIIEECVRLSKEEDAEILCNGCNENINNNQNDEKNNKGIFAGIELSTAEKEILKFLYESAKEVSSRDISNHIKKSVSQTTRYLKKLINWGFVTVIGGGRTTKYAITNIGIKYVEILGLNES